MTRDHTSSNEVLLSIVTVTKNDPEGLQRTLESAAPLRDRRIEHIVVDGTNRSSEETPELPELLSRRTQVINEPDAGLYDAMNKGATLAQGRYLVFLNGGDHLSASLDWPRLRESLEVESAVVFAYSLERYKDDRYIRPGLGRETRGPYSHPSTFYPRAFFEEARYSLDMPLSSDGDYTCRAVQSHGGLFVPVIFSEFHYGGRSTTYGSMAVLSARLREPVSFRSKARTVAKSALWSLLPQRSFYRVLGVRKYTRLSPHEQIPRLPTANVPL